jgi:hypothetical protein
MNTGYVGHRGKPAVMATVLLAIVSCGCMGEWPPARPSVVARDAVAVAGSKTVWWQHCTVAEADGAAHCRIRNAGGLVLYDEIFLPYDGPTQLTNAELTIAREPTFPGPDRIWLSNGRVLLPKSRFEDLKKFVDWLKSK